MNLEWQTKARCTTGNPDLWFSNADISLAAKAICETCPVRMDCLKYAIRTQQLYGVWGGLSPNQRTRLVNIHRGVTGRASRRA